MNTFEQFNDDLLFAVDTLFAEDILLKLLFIEKCN